MPGISPGFDPLSMGRLFRDTLQALEHGSRLLDEGGFSGQEGNMACYLFNRISYPVLQLAVCVSSRTGLLPF